MELINKLKNEGFKSFKRADLDSAPEKLYELKKDNNSSLIDQPGLKRLGSKARPLLRFEAENTSIHN
jgi:hypothetical protein